MFERFEAVVVCTNQTYRARFQNDRIIEIREDGIPGTRDLIEIVDSRHLNLSSEYLIQNLIFWVYENERGLEIITATSRWI